MQEQKEKKDILTLLVNFKKKTTEPTYSDTSPLMNSDEILGFSPSILTALKLVKKVATSSATILLTGESGTGKEVFAKYIHSQSKTPSGPFVAINCSAIPENLLESELFGHAKGSFTGALDRRNGLFEEAQNGTLFLDEIGDLSPSLQAKLLRVLQERKIRRVGENQSRPINCRIISATHKELPKEIKAGRFREDLFFRLNVVPISIPALRDRKEDIVLIAEHFLEKFTRLHNAPAISFSRLALDFLVQNPWRGNIRELENTIERAVLVSESSEIRPDDFMPLSNLLEPQVFHSENESLDDAFVCRFSDRIPTVDEVIRRYIEFAVAKNNGARDKTAKEIGIDRKTLYKKLKLEETFTIVSDAV